jgi:hypothetical protein
MINQMLNANMSTPPFLTVSLGELIASRCLCLSHGVSARARLELTQDSLDVGLYRLGSDSERPSNAFIGHAPRYQLQNGGLSA